MVSIGTASMPNYNSSVIHTAASSQIYSAIISLPPRSHFNHPVGTIVEGPAYSSKRDVLIIVMRH